MILKPKYTFVIKDTTGALYEFNNCTQRAYEWYENDIGRCRFFVPYSDLKLTATSVPSDYLSEILIYRDNILKWQGMIQMLQDGLSGVWVYGETFLAALAWYGVRYDQVYTAAGINTIVSDEYDDILTRGDNFLSYKVTKGTIETPTINGTENGSTLPVTRTFYNEDFLSVLKTLTALSRSQQTDQIDGDPQNTVFNISFSETTPTFSFLRNVGTTKEDVIFELDSEIIDFNTITDFRSIHSAIKSFTVTSGPEILTSDYNNIATSSFWRRREFYPFFPNLNSQADLDLLAKRVQIDSCAPFTTTNIKFAAGLKPFDGYSMGDKIRLRIKRGRIDIGDASLDSGYKRVVGMEVNIDDTGVENAVPVLQNLVNGTTGS